MNLVKLGQRDIGRDPGHLRSNKVGGDDVQRYRCRCAAVVRTYWAEKRYDDRLGKTGEVEDKNGGRSVIMDGGDDGEIGWR